MDVYNLTKKESNDLMIIEQLYFGNHLSEKELERAVFLIEKLQKELKSRI